LAAGTRDPLLAARLSGERKQLGRMSEGLAKRIFAVPWLTTPPIGFAELSKLCSPAVYRLDFPLAKRHVRLL
jgi:arsenite-transporting ATPase